MKILFVAVAIFCLSGCVFGQAQDGTAELQRLAVMQPAALIVLPYSPEVVKQALAEFISYNDERGRGGSKNYLLSSQTRLVRSSEGEADLHFLIGLSNPVNVNESIVYLKLNSSVEYSNGGGSLPVRFNMEDAKDYLNQLAFAMEPYASLKQLELQRKKLSDAEEKHSVLIDKGNQLEKRRVEIISQAKVDEQRGRLNSTVRNKMKNDSQIDENFNARLNLGNDIAKQKLALELISR